MNYRNQWLGVGAAVALLGLASSVQAQTVKDAFQLGLGTSLFAVTDATIEADAAVDTEVEIESTSYGLHGDSGVTLVLGYGLSEQLVLGGYLQAGGENGKTTTTLGGLAGEEETETTAFGLGPRAEFMFLDGAVRPFIGASVGYASLTQDSGTATTELGGVELAIGFGLRWFAAPGFSIDPLLQFGYTSVSGEIDPDGAAANTDLEGSGTSIGVGLGISGWL